MKAVVKITLACAVCLAIGLSVAYYNTASLGYDNANIISFESDEVKIFDYDIKYEEVKETAERVKNAIPDLYVTI